MRLWHILVFLVALVVFGAARAPATLVARQVPGVFTYERIGGTAWAGRVEGVHVGPFQSDALNWRLSALDLLGGRAAVSAGISGGDLDGEGRAAAALGGRRSLRIPRLRIAGGRIGAAALSGATEVSGLDIAFASGACAHAEGQINSDVLAQSGRALNFNGPTLTGAAACDGDDALVRMTGENSDAALVDMTLRLQPDGGGTWRIAVAGAGADAQSALAAAGFQASPNSGQMVMSGDFRWFM
ncbi:MAG: type II secretion system protein N [Hyphomonadaceae bacterium]